ncbi:MAG: hypothetical protein V4722_19365 [Bacteroidota bacterium]
MKNFTSFISLLIFIGLLSSCGGVRKAPKYSFANGLYTFNTPGEMQRKVYVENSDDSIYAYPVVGDYNSFTIDTSKKDWLSFPQQHSKTVRGASSFRQSSFDIDFLTIPFKLRPEVKTFPAQFNTNLNGAVYLGFRNDAYRLWYKKSPLNRFDRHTMHYGFSFGFFTGLGGTAMNPWVTENQVSSEYDGVAWSKGIAAIIGINNFTIGLSLGWDHLLDQNKKHWIYQGKPWLGLAFGLNLN